MSRSTSRFVAGTCNTICDRTGFKIKLSETEPSWDGYQVIPAANSLRNPQDFAPTILKPKVFKDSRSETFYNTDAIPAFTPI